MALTSRLDIGSERAAADVRGRLQGTTRDVSGTAFRVLLQLALLVAVAICAVLLIDQFNRGWDVLSTRLGDFLNGTLRSRPTDGAIGIAQGLKGSLWIAIFVVVFAFPLGIGAAIYLEEYAPRNRVTSFIDINIRNLAGVPSVVYGILGLAIFVKALDGVTGGNTLIAAGITLAVLVLPIVIITSAEAIRAVPVSLREAGYGVGATRWEVVRHHVLPYAAPGIITGTILSLARALGEAAPLILVGAITGSLANPGWFDVGQLSEKFTAMPIVITTWAGRPEPGFRALTAAAIVVLLVVVLAANLAAILLRNRFEKEEVMSVIPETLPEKVVDLTRTNEDEGDPERAAEREPVVRNLVFELDAVDVHYGDFRAVRDVTLGVAEKEITAFIGPSGCGKTTVLRCLNRMNDLIEIARVGGKIHYRGVDLYDPRVSPVEVRRRIGMVFQKPNPFPKSIYDNVAYGPRIAGTKKGLDDIVEKALHGAALWDEVKDRLKASGLSLSGGQQQRLCIARAIATEPEVLLMDEPCSALDPIATARIEDLMQEIKFEYTIVIVTHNMQQAARVSDRTAFFTTEVNPVSDTRTGVLVEFDETDRIFSNPADERTENYVTGRFG